MELKKLKELKELKTIVLLWSSPERQGFSKGKSFVLNSLNSF